MVILQAEGEACYRAVTLASQANCPLYVTRVNSKTSADVIANMRRKGKVEFKTTGRQHLP